MSYMRFIYNLGCLDLRYRPLCTLILTLGALYNCSRRPFHKDTSSTDMGVPKEEGPNKTLSSNVRCPL